MTFEFPDIFPEDKAKEDNNRAQETLDKMNEKFSEYLDVNKKRPGLPGWFSI